MDPITLEGVDGHSVGYVAIPRELTVDPAEGRQVAEVEIGRAWGPIATTPYPGEPGGTPASIVGDPTGGMSSPGVVLPESAVQLIEDDGSHVAWLTKAKAWNFRRSKATPGAGEAVLALTDALAAEAVWPRQLRFYDRGQPRQRALIEDRDDDTISQQEEAGQDVSVGGPGALALFGRYTLDPIRFDLQPVQDSMRFSPFHPDYPRASTWPFARNVGEYDTPTDLPGGGTNIWGPSGTHTFAPGGSVYLRGPAWTNPRDQVLAFPWHVDNTGFLYLDGAPIDDLSRLDSNNYLRTHERRLFVSAGVHYLGVGAFNQSSATPGPAGNPGHVNAQVRTLDSNGQLGDILHATSTSWRAYEFPQVRPASLQRPGWTAGEILIYILEHIEEKSGRIITRTFTASRDSRGVLWPNIIDFTANLGDLLRVVLQLAELHCDLEMAAGTDELHAWLKDTRGTASGVTLPDGYSDQTDGCLKGLRHRTEPPLFTVAKLRWRDGWVEVRNEDAIAAGVYVERKVDVPLVDTEATAERIGEALISVFGEQRVQGSAELRPLSAIQRPGVGFDVADTITAPDRDLDHVTQVVQTWAHSADRNGKISWGIEYGDVMFDREERLDDWLAALGDGAVGGRTLQSTLYRQEVLPTPEQHGRAPLIFDHDASDATGESRRVTLDDHGTIQAFTVDIPGGEGGTFSVLVNGSVVDSLVVGAGPTSATERGWDRKVEPGDKLSISSTAAIAYVATVRIT